MNKQERLPKMVEQDLDARGISTLFGIIGLFLFLIVSVIKGVTVTTVAFSFLVTQLPLLYQAWRRMKLLRTFNEDEGYKRLVRREFQIIVAMFGSLGVFTFLTWFVLDSMQELLGVALIGIIPLLILYVSMDRKLREADPEHVTNRELRQAHRKQKLSP
ncbi:MAG: hypothetical protein IKG65_07065 [Exiguobacterium sp.]|uniref:hypothetical protein n=1 Tax=unclassified Exiguobacterium TaxID=2644629 RepID=UPI001BED22CA|nr:MULTISPECIES: hypothetical protein [unclassified Exiguobacterium]MBQ6459051.1 hypothetical protein [Exiguobacterium sp.]MBR3062154.1 hypothetical protein [Exiguobacterium sp.]MBR3216956.1 hypothetical protein [Exiguobacterium sp.]